MLGFPEWLPDLPDYDSPGSQTITNVQPQASHYEPEFGLQETSSNALTARCQGAASFASAGGLAYNVAGDATKLYILNTSNSWTNVSKVGGYTTSNEIYWQFCQFNEIIIATNLSDPVQAYTMGSSTAFNDLAGSPPHALFVINVRNFLVLLNTDNSPYTVQWSDSDAPTTWTGGLSGEVQIDSNLGEIQGAVGGEYGIIFCERGTYRMDFIGSPAVFSFSKIEISPGCLCPYSIVPFGDKIFYVGQDGFYVFANNQSLPIGKDKINQFFFDDASTNYLVRANACHAVTNNLIRFIYASGSNGTTADRMIIFNYAVNRFSYRNDIMLEYIFQGRSEGYTIDGAGTIFSSIDNMNLPYNSKFWTGGEILTTAFSTNHKSGTFTGTASTALLETNEQALTKQGDFSVVTSLQPLISGNSNSSIQIGTRNNIFDNVTYSGSTTLNSVGFYPVRATGRFMRARVTINGGFNKAQGLQIINLNKGGKR
jgi:hypothetical protein